MMIDKDHPFWKPGEKYICDDIYQVIEIDPIMSQFLAGNNERAFKTLENSLKRKGCVDPIILFYEDGKFLIADGHRRYQVCKKHNIPFEVKILPFSSRNKVEDYVISNLFYQMRPLTEKKHQHNPFYKYFEPDEI